MSKIAAGDWSVRRKVSESRGRRWIASLLVHSDGRRTGPIVKIEGNLITTASGSVYELEGEVSVIGEEPFYLWDGEAYPPGATVPSPPPAHDAPLDEAMAYYTDHLIVVFPEGDYEIYKDNKKGAFNRARITNGKVILNGVEVTEESLRAGAINV